MVRKIFKKRKENQNKIKPRGRKRKIFATISLALSLLFGKSRLSSSQSPSPNFVNQEVHQRLNDNREFNLVEGNDQQVILAKAEGKGSNTPGGVHGFTPAPKRPRPVRPPSGYTPKIGPWIPPKVVDQGLGGAPNPGGDGNAQFDDKCPAPNKEQSQESSTNHHDFTQKSKIKKKRNQHLNQQIEVNGENFEFERDQIEKKAPSHGTDFGLDPDYGPDGKIIRDRKTGKPRAKQNKENYEKFTDNLSEFVKDPKSEKIEPQDRKGRENEQDVVGFLNRKDRRFVIFDRHTKKYITGWVMNDLQYQEFLDNNNII